MIQSIHPKLKTNLMKLVSSWGRLYTNPHQLFHPAWAQDTFEIITSKKPGLPYGMGRSYGDVCLNSYNVLWMTKALDKYISFDSNSGQLVCETGVLLGNIQGDFLPQGWMLPVTPGTQFVTLGGAIANDVHGKNHNSMGSLGHHILQLRLLRTDGSIIDCGPNHNTKWFRATIGGMGLTGLILSAKIQLGQIKSPWLSVDTIPFQTLAECFQMITTCKSNWEYLVAWFDSQNSRNFGRGFFMGANPIVFFDSDTTKKRQISIPFVPPCSLINRGSIRLVNTVYYYKNKRKFSKIISLHSFLYPLDKIENWNRIHGPRGFFQYQCVFPKENAQDAIISLLSVIKNSKINGFLPIIKLFGEKESIGMMSFPKPGITLAIDFPHQGNTTLNSLKQLDDIVLEAKGRVYLAKDARMNQNLFIDSYPQLQEFLKYRDSGISSDLSRRLMGY